MNAKIGGEQHDRQYVIVPVGFVLHDSTREANAICADVPHGKGFRLLKVRSGKPLTRALARAAVRVPTAADARSEVAALRPDPVDSEHVE